MPEYLSYFHNRSSTIFPGFKVKYTKFCKNKLKFTTFYVPARSYLCLNACKIFPSIQARCLQPFRHNIRASPRRKCLISSIFVKFSIFYLKFRKYYAWTLVDFLQVFKHIFCNRLGTNNRAPVHKKNGVYFI